MNGSAPSPEPSEAPPWLPQAWREQLPTSEPERGLCLRTLHILGEEMSAPLPLLRNYIDDSRYAIDQWLLAMASFSAWMDQQQRRSPVAHQLNYLHCATWAPEAELGWPLVELLHEMLETYGYDGPEGDDVNCAQKT